jgi:hypothetical protein
MPTFGAVPTIYGGQEQFRRYVQFWSVFRHCFQRSVVAVVSGESGFIFYDSILLGLIMSSGDSFGVCFTGKNYSLWEFQFRLFVTRKELWGQIDGSDPAPTEPKELAKWKVKNARVMSWILRYVDPLIVLNLRAYKIAQTMREYLLKVYHQDNTAHRFQLEYEIAVTLKAISPFRNIFLVFRIYGENSLMWFMRRYLLHLSLLFRLFMSRAREINF